MNSIILLEVTQKLDNKTLESLSHTSLWNEVKLFSEDQLWWYHRTEYLVGRSLKPQQGNWRRVYKSLEKNGLIFNPEQDYGSHLLVSVLLEIGVHLHSGIVGYAKQYLNLRVFEILLSDPRIDLSSDGPDVLIYACAQGRTKLVKLLLSDPRIGATVKRYYGSYSVIDDCLVRAMEEDRDEVIRILLADSRADCSLGYSWIIRSASGHGDIELVELLLADPRVDPSIGEDSALLRAVENGHLEVVELLLSDPRVSISQGDDHLALTAAVRINHLEIVRLLLSRVEDSDDRSGMYVDSLLSEASRKGSIEIVRLFLESGKIDSTYNKNLALRLARKYKRFEVEKLLLEREDVRRLDELLSREED